MRKVHRSSLCQLQWIALVHKFLLRAIFHVKNKIKTQRETQAMVRKNVGVLCFGQFSRILECSRFDYSWFNAPKKLVEQIKCRLDQKQQHFRPARCIQTCWIVRISTRREEAFPGRSKIYLNKFPSVKQGLARFFLNSNGAFIKVDNDCRVRSNGLFASLSLVVVRRFNGCKSSLFYFHIILALLRICCRCRSVFYRSVVDKSPDAGAFWCWLGRSSFFVLRCCCCLPFLFHTRQR